MSDPRVMAPWASRRSGPLIRRIGIRGRPSARHAPYELWMRLSSHLGKQLPRRLDHRRGAGKMLDHVSKSCDVTDTKYIRHAGLVMSITDSSND